MSRFTQVPAGRNRDIDLSFTPSITRCTLVSHTDAKAQGVDPIPAIRPRDRLVVATVSVGAVLGGVVLITVAILTAEIDVDDLFDSLSSIRIPALLLVAVIVCASMFLAGRAWARWFLAVVLAAGSVWILVLLEISGIWLRAALAIAFVWGLCAVTLTVSPSVKRYVAAMANHWVIAYERLIGPLRNEEDACRWLSMLDTWDEGGVLTRGDRKRIVRALSAWSERAGEITTDVGARIEKLIPQTDERRQRSLARRVVERR